MKKEVEIQAIIKNPGEIEKKLRKIGKFIGARRQVDKYFVPPCRDFFAVEPPLEYLRIRFEKGKNHLPERIAKGKDKVLTSSLNYSFLHFNRNGYLQETDEYETLVVNPKVAEEIFQKIGMINRVTVVKTRKYFNCGNFEVTLDKVENLGNFIEVEAKKNFGGIEKTKKSCLNFLKSLNVKYEIKSQMGYPRMLYRKLKPKVRKPKARF